MNRSWNISLNVDSPAGKPCVVPGVPGRAEGGRPGGADGLVTCAITGRFPTSPTPVPPSPLPPQGDYVVGPLWQPLVITAELLARVAKSFPAVREAAGPGVEQGEGPRWEIVISPGAVQVRTTDWAKSGRYRERETQRHITEVDALAGALSDRGEFPADPEPCREITGWSRKSRARMVHRLCELDYTPLLSETTQLPAMLTLTYPGDWLPVAHNGRAVKRHLKLLRKRYRRAWGQALVGVWKLEFQRRGAPHVHVLMLPPPGSAEGYSFREWISQAWAQIVAHPDPQEYRNHLLAGTGLDFAQGLRSRDPKRVAVYFTKHGSFAAKDYQHCVPEPWQHPGQGPGRFWGYWGLRPARAGIRVLPAHGITAGRILRRWARAQRTTRRSVRARVEHTTGRTRYRASRVRVVRLPGNRGWVSCNNGATLAAQLARYLTTTAQHA